MRNLECTPLPLFRASRFYSGTMEVLETMVLRTNAVMFVDAVFSRTQQVGMKCTISKRPLHVMLSAWLPSWMRTDSLWHFPRAFVQMGQPAPPEMRGRVDRFLNRILGLAIKDQALLFQYFNSTYDATVAASKSAGTFDDGARARDWFLSTVHANTKTTTARLIAFTSDNAKRDGSCCC